MNGGKNAGATGSWGAPPPQEYYAPPPEMPAPEEDMAAQIERLGTLYAQGLLTEEEFTAAKQKVLAG